MNARLLAAAGAALLASLSLQSLHAQDPSPPPGGFQIQWQRDVLLSWSDQYQTRIDIAYPSFAAPSTGWPGVLVVHGGGRSRKVGWAQEMMQRLAMAGFVAFGYDVRGQGDCPTLNPKHGQDRFPTARRIADMADCIHLLSTRLKGILDTSRLGTYGQSQGGGHGFRAAAYSGRTLPTAGFTTTMPNFASVVTHIQVFDQLEDALPGGTLFQAGAVVGGYDKFGATHSYVQAFLKDDVAAGKSAILAETGQVVLPLLKTSDTALFVSNSWDDGNHIVNANADAFAQLKPGVPRRLLLTTGGHGSAKNNSEDLLQYESAVRWHSRILKGHPERHRQGALLRSRGHPRAAKRVPRPEVAVGASLQQHVADHDADAPLLSSWPGALEPDGAGRRREDRCIAEPGEKRLRRSAVPQGRRQARGGSAGRSRSSS